MATWIEVDKRRRITLPKEATHQVYVASVTQDGTITLTPGEFRTALEDALRTRPGYIKQLERDAADAGRDVPLAEV
jgi:hypothetical protein